VNDFIDDLTIEDHVVKTRHGESLVADLVVRNISKPYSPVISLTRIQVPCRGGKMNTEFIATLGEDVLWSSKCVRINPAFQLLHHKRIFAAGDVIEWEEQKQLSKALNHADMIAKNVVYVAKREDPPMIYKGSAEVIGLTMGKVSLIKHARLPTWRNRLVLV
jgi:hypothetical protein